MTQIPATDTRLIDRFGRHVSYLRISVTDRCDFRCVYCMEEEMEFLPRQQLLTLEETAEIAAAFCRLGVTKLRVTGGEPLVRRNVLSLFHALGSLDGLHELTLTTNGSQLARHAAELKRAGVKRLNLSLDTLRPERFRAITRVGDLTQTLAGLEAALAEGFERIKINSVILRGRNHDEVRDLARFALQRGMDICYIEEMPLGHIGDHDRAQAYFSSNEVLTELSQEFDLTPTSETTGGPARYFRVDDTDNRVGLISPHSHNFCDSCNRVRLTAEGRLLLCLGQEHSVDLKHVVRAHPGDRKRLEQAIVEAMKIKPKGHDFNLQGEPVILRHMNATGG
jgi:GTP 3',8-cyclase